MWNLYDYSNEGSIVICPLNDIRPHIIRSKFCLCNPIVEYKHKLQTIIHNAYDGRDRIEKFDAELLKNEN